MSDEVQELDPVAQVAGWGMKRHVRLRLRDDAPRIVQKWRRGHPEYQPTEVTVHLSYWLGDDAWDLDSVKVQARQVKKDGGLYAQAQELTFLGYEVRAKIRGDDTHRGREVPQWLADIVQKTWDETSKIKVD